MKEADNSIPLVPGLSPGAGAASRNSTLTSGFVTENHEIRVEQRENHQEDHHEDEEFPVDEDGEDLFKFDLPDQFHETEMETVLQQLMGDAELHKLLSQEKMRCETHKNNYSKLKAEYLRLLHDNQVLSSQLSQLEADRVDAHEASNQLHEQAQTSIKKLSKEIEDLQVLIPSDAEKLDLENKISAASQAKWKVRIETAIEDLEASKLSVHNLLQDNLCLKTLLQHSAEENERVQEETELKYQKRISALEKQSRLLESAGHPKIASLEQEINNLAKENAKSKSKIKFLEISLQDAQDSNRVRELNTTVSAAEQSKSEAILSAKITRLEAEKQEFEASLRKARNEITNLRVKLQEMSTETNQLKNDLKNASDKVEEQSNQHEMTLNSLKMIQTKEKAGLLCEVDKVKKQLKDAQSVSLKSSLAAETLKQEMEQLKRKCNEDLSKEKLEENKVAAEREVRISELMAANKSLQAQLVEAKSRQNEPSDVSKSQVLKAGQQLQRLQDQLASQADLHRGLERENEMLRKVNQSCKEEAERLLLVIQEKEREEEEEVVRQQQQRQHLHQQQQSKQHGRVLEKHPAIDRISSEGVVLAEIGIQVDLPPKTPSKNVIQEGEENVSKLKSQLAELQNKQKRFAKLFEEAPTTKSKFKL